MGNAKDGCCEGGRCSGKSQPKAEGMARRDFLKAAAVSAGGLAVLGGSAWARAADRLEDHTLQVWKQEALAPRGERRVYRGKELEHIATPLGGIGAGQVYLSGRGEFVQWQNVNNFNSSAFAPGAMFGIRTRTAEGRTTARLLQETSRHSIPGVTAVEFSGEFPYAWLRYLDGQLPVDVSLEAYSPFIPLNTKDSALPAALFRFTLENRRKEAVEASLLFTAPNLTGWDGYASLEEGQCVDFHSNVNTAETRNSAVRVTMTAAPGNEPGLAEAREVTTNDDRVVGLLRLFRNVTVTPRRSIPTPTNAPTSIVWLSNLGADMSEPALHVLLAAVEQGAGLVVAGDQDGFLACAAMAGDDANRVVFEDWDTDGYARWTLEGNCFGSAPATGTLPNQTQVEGWRGAHYVNTYVGGDDSTGKATSRPFTISHNYVHIQVGGGKFPGETCVNLRIGGQVVQSATGDNTERLRPVRWDVSAHKGREAVIEIVDARQGGWGHVLVGDIVFSDLPAPPFIDAAVAQRCKDALPFTFASATMTDEPTGIPEAGLVEGHGSIRAGRRLVFQGFKLKPGAVILLEAEDGTPLIVAGHHGKGRLVVCNGDVLEWLEPGQRKAVAGRLLGESGAVAFEPQTGRSATSPFYGSMVIAALDAGSDATVSACAQWRDPTALWNDFASDGQLEPSRDTAPAPPGETWNGAVCVAVTLAPGETREVLFALTWHYPNRTRDARYGWGPAPGLYDHRLGNRYNTWFTSAGEVVRYVEEHRERLALETQRFHDTFYNSSLPRWLLDGVSANFATLCSPIFVWLEDGTFGGFEGADACCPMNCTHVYNYAMTTAYLYPELERNVRESDLLVQMHPEKHFIPHRLKLPLALPRLGDEIGGPHHHALDGELSALLKTYREWRQCGDRLWLEKVWPNVVKVMRHVWKDHDVDGDGVLKGEQPNTYDTHLFGSNTFIGTLYLAALRSVERMALVMGDDALARDCRSRYDSGRDGYQRICWNGEYYENAYDAPGATPDTYNENNCYGPGCFSDQLLGQWWAHLLDLGHVLPTDGVRGALRSIYTYNWRSDLSGHVHNQRVFAEGHEKGLLTGTWPRGGRPERPILYCDEVWTGIEYHVAATMIYEGMVEEGMFLAKAARDRYTGNQRNPFAEIECGHHYARALSSYSLLHALAGYDYDAAASQLTFAPRFGADDHSSFFCAAHGWGSLSARRQDTGSDVTVCVAFGRLALATLRLRKPSTMPTVAATLDGREQCVKALEENEFITLAFEEPLDVKAGQTLAVVMRMT